MKREELEKYIGKKVQIILFDKEIIEGELEKNGVITEEERRNMSQGNGGQLNPDWVEWLMGFPIGWTDIGT